LFATACSGGGDESAGDGGPTTTAPLTVVTGTTSGSATSSLGVALSQGEASATVPAVANVVDGIPLNAAAISAVTDGLPAWIPDENDRAPFNRPAESLPRPIVGNTIGAPFPATSDTPPPEVESGPLEVLRFQPEGDVGIAPFVSVTFNRAMVPLGTVDQVDSSDVPVTLVPEPPGRWQWIGTRTLRFEHDPEIFDRLPMATHYRVEVAAGTQSVSGGALAKSVSWEFVTPAPTVQSLAPMSDSLPLDQVFVAQFDQRVDPDAALAHITLSADEENKDLRLATPEEIAADEQVSRITQIATEGTWVAFRAGSSLGADKALRIKVGPDVAVGGGSRHRPHVPRVSRAHLQPTSHRRSELHNGQPVPERLGSDRFVQQRSGSLVT